MKRRDLIKTVAALGAATMCPATLLAGQEKSAEIFLVGGNRSCKELIAAELIGNRAQKKQSAFRVACIAQEHELASTCHRILFEEAKCLKPLGCGWMSKVLGVRIMTTIATEDKSNGLGHVAYYGGYTAKCGDPYDVLWFREAVSPEVYESWVTKRLAPGGLVVTTSWPSDATRLVICRRPKDNIFHLPMTPPLMPLSKFTKGMHHMDEAWFREPVVVIDGIPFKRGWLPKV